MNLADSDVPVFRVLIKSVIKREGAPEEEKEEILEEPMRGVEVELQSFFEVVSGKKNTTDLGDPLDALRDVAFIQAALESDGNLVNLVDLVPRSLSL